ncbi:MAG: hypothetical protein OSJ58_08300, partial [Dysosmobacter sp.]|nr:hypothetical protein [Dysosmobacter sp.]
AKEKHGMRYTLYRGLAQVSKWVRLKFAAMNLKKLARWKAKRLSTLSFLLFAALMYLYALWPCQNFFLAGRFSTSWRLLPATGNSRFRIILIGTLPLPSQSFRLLQAT